jgi:hypothetical protein
MWNGMVSRLAIDLVWLIDFEKRDAIPFQGFSIRGVYFISGGEMLHAIWLHLPLRSFLN